MGFYWNLKNYPLTCVYWLCVNKCQKDSTTLIEWNVKYILNIHKVNKHNRFAWYQAKNILITDNTLDTAAAAEKHRKFHLISHRDIVSTPSRATYIHQWYRANFDSTVRIFHSLSRELEVWKKKKTQTLIFIVNCCQSTYCVRLIEKKVKWNSSSRESSEVSVKRKVVDIFFLSSTEARRGIR